MAQGMAGFRGIAIGLGFWCFPAFWVYGVRLSGFQGIGFCGF